MKKIPFLLVTWLFAIVLLQGCGSGGSADETSAPHPNHSADDAPKSSDAQSAVGSEQ